MNIQGLGLEEEGGKCIKGILLVTKLLVMAHLVLGSYLFLVS